MFIRKNHSGNNYEMKLSDFTPITFANAFFGITDMATPLHVAVFYYQNLSDVIRAYNESPFHINNVDLKSETPLDKTRKIKNAVERENIVTYLRNRGAITSEEQRNRWNLSNSQNHMNANENVLATIPEEDEDQNSLASNSSYSITDDLSLLMFTSTADDAEEKSDKGRSRSFTN
jgi:hypothetical protein